ncbi:MAG: hypothetical protein LBJ00_10360 [Planctomycetaceae bacterium]|nr:hypothetical protein [Planctomycetaceae bacterium]
MSAASRSGCSRAKPIALPATVYSSRFEIPEAEHVSAASRSGCSRAKPTAHTGYGIHLVIFSDLYYTLISFNIWKSTCTKYTQVTLNFPKLNAQTQQREAVVQWRSPPPIPASV